MNDWPGTGEEVPQMNFEPNCCRLKGIGSAMAAMMPRVWGMIARAYVVPREPAPMMRMRGEDIGGEMLG